MQAGKKWWFGYGALAVADVALAGIGTRGAVRARQFTKPALMPMLARAVCSSEPGPASPRRSLLAGLALSGLGDIVLLRPGPRAFLGGLSAFLAAHVTYAVGFRPAPCDPPVVWTDWVGPVEVATLAGTPLLAAMAWRKDPVLAGPVTAYALGINAMAWSAARLAAVRPGLATRRLRRGARLFMVSDLLLGLGTFLPKTMPSWLNAAVMGTYVAAQGWIAAGVCTESQGAVATDPLAADA